MSIAVRILGFELPPRLRSEPRTDLTVRDVLELVVAKKRYRTTTIPEATQAMLDTYPQEINLDRPKLAATIDALIACAQACTACADACLSEDMVADLTKCIRTNLDWEACGSCARTSPTTLRSRSPPPPRRC